MHSPELGVGQSPMLALSYIIAAAIIFLSDRYCASDIKEGEESDKLLTEDTLGIASHE